jgi:hypothetical protein
MPGDVVRWEVSGKKLTLVVLNQYESDLHACYRHNKVMEFLDMESGKIRCHDNDTGAFLRDLHIFLVERGHAQGA